MSGTFTAPYSPAMSLIQPLSGLTTIWADQNAPRPAKPYLALRVMSRKSDQNDEYGPVASDGTQFVVSNTSLTLEIQAYGDGAVGILDSLATKLGFQSTIITCIVLGVAIRNRGPITNITQLLDKSMFEDRASMEIVIGYRDGATDTVGIIDAVNGTGTGVLPASTEPVPFSVPSP